MILTRVVKLDYVITHKVSWPQGEPEGEGYPYLPFSFLFLPELVLQLNLFLWVAVGRGCVRPQTPLW